MAWFRTADPIVRREFAVTKRQGRVELRVPRYPELRGTLRGNRLCIEAARHGIVYDYLLDLDCEPVITRDGVVCRMCEPSKVFRDHEALWQDHFFDELARFANRIAQSVGIEVTETLGWSQARLVRPEELRDLSKMAGPNDGTRTLIESIMSRAVIAALNDLRRVAIDGLLIGTLAYNHHAKPRYEDEIALLVRDDIAIPNLDGFDRLSGRPGGVRLTAGARWHGERSIAHRASGTKVWLVTPAALRLSPATAKRVRASAVVSDDIMLADRSGLIAILLADRRLQASADIVGLLRLGLVDVSGFDLPPDQLARLASLRVEADHKNRQADELLRRTGGPLG